MKALLLLAITGSALLAQTPPPAKSAPKAAAPATKTGAPSKTGAPAAPRPNPLLNPAALKAKAPDLFRVKFATTKGDFTVEVHRDWAPLGADRFYNLVKLGFFNDVAFFRVIKGFMMQFGIAGDPAVARQWQPATIKDDPAGKHSN